MISGPNLLLRRARSGALLNIITAAGAGEEDARGSARRFLCSIIELSVARETI
jgi:hypothetical protein